MNDMGYIYYWRQKDNTGRILVCRGDFAGRDVSFDLQDCAPTLQSMLKDTSRIEKAEQYPPPVDALQVQFQYQIRQGRLVAIEIQPPSMHV